MDNKHKFFCYKSCFLRVPRNILTKAFWGKCIYFLSVSFFEQTFSAFCQNTSNRIVKTEIYVSTGNLWRKLCFLKKIWVFLPFSEMSKKTFELLTKTFWQGCEYCFRCGHRMILRSLFAPWANPFRRTVEDFPLGMSEKRSKILNISWHWAEKFRPFVKKIEAGLPELLSTCLQEQFERFGFLLKVLNFFFLFRTLSEKFLVFVNFFQWCCQ